MANQAYVREFLKTKNIEIPAETQFIGGLHDTTRDELVYYDIDNLSAPNQQLHLTNIQVFKKALQNNAKERARQRRATQAQRRREYEFWEQRNT